MENHMVEEASSLFFFSVRGKRDLEENTFRWYCDGTLSEVDRCGNARRMSVSKKGSRFPFVDHEKTRLHGRRVFENDVLD